MQIISRAEARAAGQEFYFTGNPCKHGHVERRRVSSCKCIQCAKDEGASRYRANKDEHLRLGKKRYRENRNYYLAQQAEYRKKNAEAKRATDARYRRENAERIKQWKRENYLANKDEILAKQKDYYEKNKDAILEKQRVYLAGRQEERREYNYRYRRENRKAINKYFRERRRTDPIYQAKCKMREMVKRCLGLAGRFKESTSEQYLGYSAKDLQEHIERQFLKGMGWHNRSEWHVDHITPISWFIENGITDPKRINCLSNLKPVWAMDNYRKGSDIEYLL